MIALIDGDMVIHMATAAQQSTVDWEDGEDVTVHYDAEDAARHAFNIANQWREGARCKEMIFCMSSGDNFRKKVLPTYKHNRVGIEKPKAYYDVIDLLEADVQMWRVPGLEADDIMGIYGSRDPDKYVVCSRDKDMGTVPGWVYNPDKDQAPVRIHEVAATRKWMMQTMMGDSTDGYTGIPRIGEKKAEEILQNPRRLMKSVKTLQSGKNKGKQKIEWVLGGQCTLWESMVSHAAKADMSEAELIVQARVARILRDGEYDAEKNTIKLWTPTGRHEELSNAQ